VGINDYAPTTLPDGAIQNERGFFGDLGHWYSDPYGLFSMPPLGDPNYWIETVGSAQYSAAQAMGGAPITPAVLFPVTPIPEHSSMSLLIFAITVLALANIPRWVRKRLENRMNRSSSRRP